MLKFLNKCLWTNFKYYCVTSFKFGIAKMLQNLNANDAPSIKFEIATTLQNSKANDAVVYKEPCNNEEIPYCSLYLQKC